MSEPTPLLEYANPLADQPIGSRALCERHPDGGITFTLPPEGVARMLPGLVGLAIPTVFLIFLSVVGAGIFLVAAVPLAALWATLLRSAMRPTIISVRGGCVTLVSGAALLSPVRSWPTAEVTGVRVSFSGMSVRVRLTGDLTLRMRRRDAQLIAGGDKAELEWIARGLRETLGLPAL